MWSEYFSYLMKLTKAEREQQILIMVGFWCVVLLVGFIADKIEKKEKQKNKNVCIEKKINFCYYLVR